MSVKKRFEEMYEKGELPWDTGRPDFNLINIVTQMPILKCKALDIGCGTGSNAIWLAQKGFEAVGCDLVEIPIKRALKKASYLNLNIPFYVIDFLKDEILEAPFDFLFDRGCFHSFESDDDRKKFAEKAAFNLKNEGLWLSMIGTCDDKRKEKGPPKRSLRDIARAIEPYFKILSIKSGCFDSNRDVPSKAWICLMQKRI
jgi:methyl halide transferase